MPELLAALDAFMAEHRGCWRLHEEGLESGEDVGACWTDCACGTTLLLPQ